MKAQDFGSHLKSLLQLLEAGGVSDQVQALRLFIPLFSAAGNMTVAQIVKLSKDVKADSDKAPVLGELAPLLSAYQEFIGSWAKKGFLTDLEAVLEIIGANRNASVEEFVIAFSASLLKSKANKQKANSVPAPVDESLVEDYVQRINDTYKDTSRFKAVFQELQAKVGRRNVVSDGVVRTIASRFSSNVTSSTKRADALKRIEDFHKNYIELDLKNQAMGNRSAA
jgi:hypothetical protein